jgi:hypothetical protein
MIGAAAKAGIARKRSGSGCFSTGSISGVRSSVIVVPVPGSG